MRRLILSANELPQYEKGGVLFLPEEALLTPNAQDWVKDNHLKIEFQEKSSKDGLMFDCTEIRQKVIDTCNWLVRQGLVIGTWGNVSVRLADGNILITPSKVAYDIMTPEDLVVLAPDGKVVSGFRLSTSEREIHRGILNRRPDVNAVIHTHSAYAMACCAIDGGIPPISEEMAQLLGGGIPISYRFVPSEKHVELGQVICDSIGDANAVLIRNHGPVCCGKSLDEAMVCAQVVEKSAKMYLHIRQGGGVVEIEDQWVKAGRKYFLEAYGKT